MPYLIFKHLTVFACLVKKARHAQGFPSTLPRNIHSLTSDPTHYATSLTPIYPPMPLGSSAQKWFISCSVLLSNITVLHYHATTTPSRTYHLQPRTVDDLVVNDELPTTIVDDESPNAAPTPNEGTTDLGVEIILINNWKTLLDITSLGHADNTTTLLNIKDSVLLVDRSEHALDDNRWLRVADER